MKTNTASLLKLGLKAKFCLIIRCENSVFLSYDFPPPQFQKLTMKHRLMHKEEVG